ncbi:MAG: hypothetical protein P1V36_05620, partial [Planctomycetota bacterium]|nr:hypothetical protein [Planctomycetota bacterium]
GDGRSQGGRSQGGRSQGGRAPGQAEPGRKTTPRKPRPKKFRIAGEVLDEAGLPVKGATVYVLDKKRLGADRDKVDHEVSDARGRWAIYTRKTVDSWIGVVAPGYRTVLLDGDGVDVTKQIIHVVTRSPTLTVTVVDGSGAPLVEKGVQLSPWPPGGTYFCPGPLCRQGEQWTVTDSAGRSAFRQDVAAPVLVTPFIDGYHGHPASLWLADAQGEARIVMHPNASFELTLTDADAPLATDDLIRLEFVDRDTGQGVFAVTEGMQAPGLLRLEQALVPGTYHLQVSVPGRPSVLVQDVVIPEGKARASAAIPAASPAGLGRLAVRLEGNVATRQPKGRRRAPLTFLMRTDGAWAALGWRPGAPERFDATRQRIEYELEPGTYRLLVADVLTGRAAQEREIVVAAGENAKTSLAMKLGQFGALPAARDGAVYVRRLHARTKDRGVLPVFGSSRDGRQRFSRGIDLIARKVRGEDVVIGPYPVDEFEVVLQRSDGSKKTAVYR